MIMAPALVAGRTQLDELVEKTKRAVDRTAMALGLL
jgi:adenosylmethionine-8-amino-7-oxononanoate aminotransferase